MRIPAVLDMFGCPGKGKRQPFGIAACRYLSGPAILADPVEARCDDCDTAIFWPVIGPPELLGKIAEIGLVALFVCKHQIVGD
jgi:hypothetical protein